jgi:mono/diheme cytochrome c family protein
MMRGWFGARQSMRRKLLLWGIPLALFVAFAVVGYAGWRLWDAVSPDRAVPILLDVPMLSESAEAGRAAYDRRCVQCHGLHGAGTAAGPPLVHRVYRPAHHADVAFALAVRRGVRAHHWRFGDMPPQPDASKGEVETITRYIRELQRANAID